MTTTDEGHRRLTRNTVYLTAASVVQKLLSSVYFLIFPNFVGTSAAGAYFFAVSFANLFSIVVDAGLSPLIIREVAKAPASARDTAKRALRFKFFTGGGAIVALGGIAAFWVPDALRRELLIFTAFVMVIESISLTCYGVLRGLQRLRYEAIGATIHQLTVLIVGTTSVVITRESIWLGVALLVAATANMLYAAMSLKRVLREFETAPSHWALRQLGPFFTSGALTRMFAYIDVVLLGWLASNHIVGLYGAAYKLAYTFQFIPIAFNAGLYPALAQSATGDRTVLQGFVDKGIRFLLLVGLPLAVGLALFAGGILKTFLPAFIEATPALQLAVLGLPGLFLSFVFSSLLNATNRQRDVVKLLLVVVITNVALNLILIPRLLHVGASLAAFVSAWVYAGVGWWLCRENVVLSHETRRVLTRLLGALLLLLAGGFILRQVLPFFVAAPVSALLFVGAAVGFKIVGRSTWRELRQSFRSA